MGNKVELKRDIGEKEATLEKKLGFLIDSMEDAKKEYEEKLAVLATEVVNLLQKMTNLQFRKYKNRGKYIWRLKLLGTR